ncbi:Dbl-like domain-containing protein [Pisolithus microcarpus]|nr:Dbl-like domain-containing protein [Pisolithus microcarpus]
MKAFLNRFNRGHSKDKDKDKEKEREKEKNRDREKDKDSLLVPDRSDTATLSSSTNSPSPNTTPLTRKKELAQLPRLPEWPPSHVTHSRPESRQERLSSSSPSITPSQIQRSASAGTTGTSTGTPSSIASSKPLPDLSARPLPPIEEPHDADNDSGVGLPVSSPVPNPADPLDPAIKASALKSSSGSVNTTATNTDTQKKVAFLSPPQTPSGLSTTQPLPETYNSANTGLSQQSPVGAPSKTAIARFQAAHGKETRGSTSTATSTSPPSIKATSTRTAASPYPISLRSQTPFSQMSVSSTRILAVSSWSEGAEEDLVCNLGPRERTRQEVLWEIVASEERYVSDLQRMKETFIDPLLHPYASPPTTSPTPYDYDDYSIAPSRFEATQDSMDTLPPIAAPPDTKSLALTTPNIDGESVDTDDDDAEHVHGHQGNHAKVTAKHSHPRSPYRAASVATGKNGKTKETVPFPSRSHVSIPLSTHSLGKQSVADHDRDRDTARDKDRDRKDSAKTTPTIHTARVLRKFKRSQTGPDTAMQGLVPPHLLPEDLRICLEVIEGGVLEGHTKLSEGLRKRYEEQYPLVRSFGGCSLSRTATATYVLHLERALEQVDNALSTASEAKKPKNQDAAEWLKVCKSLQRLEELACEKGETGLAISLSKPFQRLLKYPLLFQNLLFHTDPSTFEYESSLQMVAEIETIVRSIEDEKIQKEDRDKTRDVFARIEGLDKVKQLAIPKPSRLLVEERQLIAGSSPPPALANKNVKGKTSLRRLSDVLGTSSGIGGKKDLWLVDASVRERTSLPLVSSTNSRTNSLPDMQGKSKYATTGLSIETWAIGDVVQPKEGVVAMEDQDKKSKMSFSYWGADKITLQKPVLKPKQSGASGSTRRVSPGGTSYGRESSANAKFGTRLVSVDQMTPTVRPGTKRAPTVTSTRTRVNPSDDSQSVKATVTRPAWDTSTRSNPANPPKRQRQTSQTSAATARPNNSLTADNGSGSNDNNKPQASPVASEDSALESIPTNHYTRSNPEPIIEQYRIPYVVVLPADRRTPQLQPLILIQHIDFRPG